MKHLLRCGELVMGRKASKFDDYYSQRTEKPEVFHVEIKIIMLRSLPTCWSILCINLIDFLVFHVYVSIALLLCM